MNQTTESLVTQPALQPIPPIFDLLKSQQHEVSYTYLMGISGEAFRFFYNRSDPLAGVNTFFHNPLRSTFKALGFKHEMHYDDTYQAAWERLQGNIKESKPTLLPFRDSSPVLTTSEGAESVIYRNGLRDRFDPCELKAKWQPMSGFLELGPLGYYQLSIGEREREPKTRDVALGSFRTASKLMRSRQRIHDCAMGLAAYEELITYLESVVQRKGKPSEKEIETVAKWGETPLRQWVKARKTAVAYLQSARTHFEDKEEIESLDKAIATYRKILLVLQKLQETWFSTSFRVGTSSRFNTLSVPIWGTAEMTVRRFKPDCRTASKRLQSILVLEIVAITALGNVVRLSEKVKM